MEFTPEDKEKLEKHHTDLYIGYGKDDPSITLRMDRVERLLERPSIRSRSFAAWKSAGVATVVMAITVWLSSVPQLITFTARVARVATLVSTSFRSRAPQVLPSVLAGDPGIGGARGRPDGTKREGNFGNSASARKTRLYRGR